MRAVPPVYLQGLGLAVCPIPSASPLCFPSLAAITHQPRRVRLGSQNVFRPGKCNEMQRYVDNLQRQSGFFRDSAREFRLIRPAPAGPQHRHTAPQTSFYHRGTCRSHVMPIELKRTLHEPYNAFPDDDLSAQRD